MAESAPTAFEAGDMVRCDECCRHVPNCCWVTEVIPVARLGRNGDPQYIYGYHVRVENPIPSGCKQGHCWGSDSFFRHVNVIEALASLEQA